MEAEWLFIFYRYILRFYRLTTFLKFELFSVCLWKLRGFFWRMVPIRMLEIDSGQLRSLRQPRFYGDCTLKQILFTIEKNSPLCNSELFWYPRHKLNDHRTAKSKASSFSSNSEQRPELLTTTAYTSWRLPACIKTSPRSSHAPRPNAFARWPRLKSLPEFIIPVDSAIQTRNLNVVLVSTLFP